MARASLLSMIGIRIDALKVLGVLDTEVWVEAILWGEA
jgi:hypothetical protein